MGNLPLRPGGGAQGIMLDKDGGAAMARFTDPAGVVLAVVSSKVPG